MTNESDISFDKWKEFEKKMDENIIDIFFFGENCIFFKGKSEIWMELLSEKMNVFSSHLFSFVIVSYYLFFLW